MRDFLRELDTLTNLKHKSIPRCEEIIQKNGTAYIIMEYVEGTPLSAYLDRYGPMSWQEARQLFVMLLDAVSYCHQRRVFHCDIHPRNIMISTDRPPMLVDFGAAIDLRALKANGSDLRIKTFTPGFSPPELVASIGRTIEPTLIDAQQISFLWGR